MKILCLCYEYPPLGGGGSRVVDGLTRALACSGDRIDLLTMAYRGLPRRQTSGGIDVRRIAPFRLRQTVCSAVEMMPYVVLAAIRARRYVRQNSYAVLHAHFIFPDGLVAYHIKKLTGLRYVITAHGSDVPGYNPERFRALHALLRPLWTRITGDAERIICPSQSLQELVRRSNKEARVAIIPNGFDSRKFVPGEKRDRILVVTRMFARKGVQYFLRALHGTATGYEIVIVGDGPYLPALRALARDLKVEATFVGALDNDSQRLKELYETSRIFVLPSEAENFPVVLLEAMSAGCAIITTRATGCEEVVGDAALLVEPRDPPAIAEALERLTGDLSLCNELGHAARDRLCQSFEWQIVADKYRAMYQSVVGERAN